MLNYYFKHSLYFSRERETIVINIFLIWLGVDLRVLNADKRFELQREMNDNIH